MIRKPTWAKKRLAVAIVCAALAGTVGLITLSQMNPRAEAAILTPYNFYDDFSGDLSQWTIVSGAWAIESGELSQSTVDASYKRGKIKINDLNVVDLVIEAKIKFMELYSAPTSNYAGFAVRHLDEDTFYWIVLRQPSDVNGVPNGNLELQFRAQFNYLVRVDLGFVGELDKFYKLKVDVEGDNFKIYVDGALKIETTDMTFQNAGSILLWTGRCSAHFDDVMVSRADEAVTPTTYTVNIRAGATQIIVTCVWSGSGNITIRLVSPITTYLESNMDIYEKTKVNYNGTSVSTFNIKRAALSIPAPSSSETWILCLDLRNVVTYQVSVETS